MAQGKRVVLITGASAGIGRACADWLDAAGWTVVGASRRGTGGASWLGTVMDVDDAVQRLLESGRAPRRLSVGKASERAGVMAKRLLPFRLFEAAAKTSLGVD
jgi:NAD(P)-dependent dehydrogenase (short-subunit alcohol dehydrogenase family)